MPDYNSALQIKSREAIALAEAGDLVIVSSDRGEALRTAWPIHRVELLYEFAYLRVFLEWEQFLESTFLRYLCGYQSKHGACSILSGQPSSSISDAEVKILGNRHYVLWHNPQHVTSRSKQFFSNGFHEAVISSNNSRISDFAAIRHRIVHNQGGARTKFDTATMNLAGRRYPASRPGRFLRDWDNSVIPPRRWIETITSEIAGLANQIA